MESGDFLDLDRGSNEKMIYVCLEEHGFGLTGSGLEAWASGLGKNLRFFIFINLPGLLC